jgi:3-isopropylmalate/(R)-2-methylmalate dehydratase small subunit
MLAVDMDAAIVDDMFANFAGKETFATVDTEKTTITLKAGDLEKVYTFKLEGFDKALIDSDGWVGYADMKY